MFLIFKLLSFNFQPLLQLLKPTCILSADQNIYGTFHNDASHEPDPRDIEIQDLWQQVDQLTKRLECLEHPNHCDDYKDESEAEEIINRSIVGHRWEDDSEWNFMKLKDWDLNIKLEISENNGTMKDWKVMNSLIG